MPALAQATGPTLQVTPPRIEQDLRTRSFSVEVSFRNNGSTPTSATFEVTGLGHDLDGEPQLPPPAPGPGTARLDATSARLAPGEVRRVTLRGTVPPGAGGVYAGVVATLAPTQASGGGGVTITQRLASLVLLRGPKPWNEAVAVETVAARPTAAGRTVQIFAQVRNSGNVHVRPAGRADVIHRGKVLTTVELKPDVVIPGFARRIGGPWTVPAGLDGPVRLVVQIDEPSPASGSGEVVFENGRLASVPEGLGLGPVGGTSLDDTEGSDDAARVVLSVVGVLLLVGLVVSLVLVARRRAGDG